MANVALSWKQRDYVVLVEIRMYTGWIKIGIMSSDVLSEVVLGVQKNTNFLLCPMTDTCKELD